MAEHKTSTVRSSLSDEEFDSLLSEHSGVFVRTPKSRTRWLATLFLGLLGLFLYTLLVVAIVVGRFDPKCEGGARVIPNILQEAVKYQPLVYPHVQNDANPYFGEPSEQLDKNWHDILKCMHQLWRFLVL